VAPKSQGFPQNGSWNHGLTTPKVTLQGSSGSSVPLNFLHVVLGKDAFPSVTDRTLFYNTDDEMKKAIKQSQDSALNGLGW
jgi:hypothetical protein